MKLNELSDQNVAIIAALKDGQPVECRHKPCVRPGAKWFPVTAETHPELAFDVFDYRMAGPRSCLFACNEHDGPALYCGHADDNQDMLKGIGHIVESQITDLMAGAVDSVTIVFTRKMLTDEQIANLPDDY